MATKSTGRCYGGGGGGADGVTLVNGDAVAHDQLHLADDDSWCGGWDVPSLLQGAPADSISLRTHVDRHESIVDAAESAARDDKDAGETVELDFVDGQVCGWRRGVVEFVA